MKVEYTDRATRQLEALYTYIAQESGATRAHQFVNDILDYCDSFETFPERGTQRDDIFSGLRLIGFRRRVTIAVTVSHESVWILGIFYGGQNVEDILSIDY